MVKELIVKKNNTEVTLLDKNDIIDALSTKSDKNHSHTDLIVDNLTTNDATKVLSAKQGKILKDLISDAINYING